MLRDKSRDFRNEKLTPEQACEIKAAFDAGMAMCFAFDKGNDAHPRISVVSKILRGYPDVILAKCDYVYLGTEPKGERDMILLIKTDTGKESFNRIVDEIIIPSGSVSQAIFIGMTNEEGIKKAVKREFANDKSCIVKKANLLIDGDKLLLTIRSNATRKIKIYQ